MNTTIERDGDTLTITTTVELPASPTFPIRIPAMGEAFNTSAAVAHLYERTDR